MTTSGIAATRTTETAVNAYASSKGASVHRHALSQISSAVTHQELDTKVADAGPTENVTQTFRLRSLFLVVAGVCSLPGVLGLGCRPSRETAENAAVRLTQAFESEDDSTVQSFRAHRSRLTTSGRVLIDLYRDVVGGVEPGSLRAVSSPNEDKEKIIYTQSQGQRQVRREPIDLTKATSRLVRVTGRFQNGTPFAIDQTFRLDKHGWTTDLLHFLINLVRQIEPDPKERGKKWVHALENAGLDKMMFEGGTDFTLEQLRDQSRGIWPKDDE